MIVVLSDDTHEMQAAFTHLVTITPSAKNDSELAMLLL